MPALGKKFLIVIYLLCRNELDLIDSDEQKYPSTFAVALDIVLGAESPSLQNYTEPWDKLSLDKLSPQLCFASKEEYWECREEFGMFFLSCSLLIKV